ncbi:hypothetical protein AALP_AAs40659U000100, partial [Arabis alpina]
AKAYQKV